MTPISKDIKDAIRSKYAFPGGYPLYLVTTDGGALCIECVRKDWKIIAHSTLHHYNDGWELAGADINWEDPDLFCDHCGENIESAYGEE